MLEANVLSVHLYNVIALGGPDNTTHVWSEEDGQLLSPSSLAAQ